jgi:hypothetical protein
MPGTRIQITHVTRCFRKNPPDFQRRTLVRSQNPEQFTIVVQDIPRGTHLCQINKPRVTLTCLKDIDEFSVRVRVRIMWDKAYPSASGGSISSGFDGQVDVRTKSNINARRGPS